MIFPSAVDLADCQGLIPWLVIAPTSVAPNWTAETEKFAPHLKVLVLHGSDRADHFKLIPAVDIVLTSYPLLVRDFNEIAKYHWHALVLDKAHHIKNPEALTALSACKLKSATSFCSHSSPRCSH